MKKTKIISLLVAAAMFCTLFTGCMGGKTVMKIGGNAISEDIYSAAISYADVMAQQSYGLSLVDYLDQEMGDGTTGADFLKNIAEGLLKEFATIRIIAQENGIELSKEEKAEIENAKQQQIDAAGGRKAFLDGLAEDGINEAFFDYMLECQYLYSKVSSELYSGDGEFAPSTEEVIASLDGYARVKHILIQTKEGDEDYAEKKAKAEQFLARAKAGEDFDALIAEVAEDGDGDPGMQSTPDGYIIDANGTSFDGSGTMVTEFTTASHALAVNGISELVPSDYGFHIIKRYPLDEAYITENIDTYSYTAGSNALMTAMMELQENVEVEYTDAYDKVDIHEILGVEKTNGAAAGVTDGEEHYEGDGHDHSADAEGETGSDAETEGDAGTEGGIEVGEAVPAE